MPIEHNLLVGLQLHAPFHYIQTSDPGAVGVGLWWADTTNLLIKRRNAGNTGWDTYGGSGGGSSGYVSPPAAGNSSGTAGQYSFDANFAYFCVATNTWLVSPLSAFPATTVYTYSSDGDANGVFYGRGFLAGGGSWTNPSNAGIITIAVSGGVYGSGSAAAVVDRATSDVFGSNVAGSWFSFDLGPGAILACNKFSYRARSSSGSFPTAFNLQGSNDNAVWTNIKVVTGISITSSAWLTTTVSPASAPYRFFRLLSTAADSSSLNYLTIGEFELYGSFTK